MGEEFVGGVCGGKRWNQPQNLFSGGGYSSFCSVAQLGSGGGGGSDVAYFGWPNEPIKGKNNNNNDSSLLDDSSIILPVDMGNSLFDNFFGFNPSSNDSNQINLLCKDGNFGSILQDEINPELCYGIRISSPTNMTMSQDGSPPMVLTASSSGDSSTITGEGGVLNSTFDPISSSASYLIQTLFDDTDDSHLMKPNYNNTNNENIMSPCSWVTVNNNCPQLTQQLQQINQLIDGGTMNVLMNGLQGSDNSYNTTTTSTLSSNIQASLLNSFGLQSTTRNPSSNFNHGSKVNNVQVRETKSKVSEQAPANKKPRIETPSPLPTFKVRKEKLGDRITALQQLVSPFGKTDTASVLHEAIEYIKFLHDQVNALSTPYLKNGAAIQQQQDYEKTNNMDAKDLRSRGLCLVPISSTYPVAQETPVDFWTPTFGGTTLR